MAWKAVKNISFYALVALIVLIAVFPFYYAILTSFASGTGIFRVSYVPVSFSVANYVSVATTG